MADGKALHDAFVDELRDSYDGEKQLIEALPKLAKSATAPELREAFESHLEETRGQVTRLEEVFGLLGEKARGKHCEGIAGIVEEGKAIMEEDFDDATRMRAWWPAANGPSTTRSRPTGRWSRGPRRWATTRRPSCCSRRSTRRRQRTRSCRLSQKAA